jgi:hypothetical protein
LAVSINGTFRGILLLVRQNASNVKSDPLGSFLVYSADHMQTINCGAGTANAATHSADVERTDLVVRWQPHDDDMGYLYFV